MSTPYDADPLEPGATGPGDHLDADLLGDLDEGLLDPAAAAAAQEHLAGCAACSRLHEEYLSVRDLLAHLPPVRMPDEVARRLDDAIAAAAAGGPGSVPSTGATVVPLSGRSPRRRLRLSTGVLQAAAAAVVVAALAAVGVGAVRDIGDSDSSTAQNATAGGAGMAEAAPTTTRLSASRHTYSAATLAADAARLARGEGPKAAISTDPTATAARTGGSAGSPGPMAPQDSVPLAAADALTGAAASDDRALSKIGLPSRAAIDRCTQALGAGRPPLAVDRGTFNGESVLVVVFAREAPNPGYEAWVVGTGCAPDDEQVRTFVLSPG